MIFAKNAVPVVDGSANNESKDVIGNRDDGSTISTLAGRLHALEEHAHSPSLVYPTGAPGVAVASAAGAWTLGAFVEIVPVSTIATPFDVHHLSIEDLDDNGTYEIVLYAGEVEIGRTKVTKNANLDGAKDAVIQMAIQPANTQIQAKVMSSVGNSVVIMSLFYHPY